MSRASATLATLSLLMLLFASQASATTFVGGTDSWTMVGPPSEKVIMQNGLLLTYHNNQAFATQGIIMMVFHNSAGQMVYFSTSTASLNASSSGIVFLVEFGLPAGSYNATIFPFTYGGVALSIPIYTTFKV